MDYTGKVITKNPVTPTQVSAPGVWTLDEALQAQKGNNWPVPGVYNPISRSLRFNSADSAYLNRTPASAGNRKTWTWSGWVKRSTLSTLQSLETVQDGGSEDSIAFQSDDTIRVYMSPVAGNGTVTTAALRDPSAWYHVVIAVDTTQATAANRTIIYVNNVNVTSSSSNYITQNSNTKFNGVLPHYLGRYANQTMPTGNWDGYMTEINFIDGQALTPSDFGLADPTTGVWVPKKYTGTYGTNGFYLNFKDNSNTTTIGYDYSGNGNNWNTNNFSVTAGAGNDSLTDVPTPWIGYSSGGDTGGVVRGNYCTLNPLDNNAVTLTNGNLDGSSTANSWKTVRATLGMSSGKWYWEFTATAADATDNFWIIGILNLTGSLSSHLGVPANGYGYYSFNGNKQNNGGTASYGNSWIANDIIGMAFDADSGKLWFSKNGTWQASGDPAAGTNAAFTSIPAGTYLPAISPYSGDANATSGALNFGQRPFAYTPPAGYRSLCTTNLPTPAIGTSSTTLADDYFNTVLYTGTGSTLGVTGVGFQPDFVWIKSRSAATDHALYDIVRGDKNQLESNTTTAETNETTGLTGFNADGFTVGSLAQVNTNAATYVAWNWKAGGVGVTNTAGSITSTVSANTTAGFSIVTYTGTGVNASVGHGCQVNGIATVPSMIIIKGRDTTYDWRVWFTTFATGDDIQLNTTAAVSNAPTVYRAAPTSTVINIGTGTAVNENTKTYVAYCFAPVAGYSAFGSYTGNGSADGPFIYTGFRPAFVLIKRTDTNGFSWTMYDNKRNTYNVANLYLIPNTSNAEASFATLDFISNGIKIRTSDSAFNSSGGTYIYMAFAENPFKYSNAR